MTEVQENTAINTIAGEDVLGTWVYGKLKGRASTQGSATLTITNRRIINCTQTKQGETREEIPVSEVRTIKGAYIATRFVILLIIGVIAVIAGIATAISSVIPGIVIIVIGAIILACWFFIKKKKFYLIITSPVHDDGMVVGSSPLAILRRRRVKTKKLRMAYDENAAKSLLESIGRLVYGQHKN